MIHSLVFQRGYKDFYVSVPKKSLHRMRTEDSISVARLCISLCLVWELIGKIKLQSCDSLGA